MKKDKHIKSVRHVFFKDYLNYLADLRKESSMNHFEFNSYHYTVKTLPDKEISRMNRELGINSINYFGNNNGTAK